MSNQVREGYKQTEIGVIPEDWEVRLMSSLATIQRGASPRPIDSPIWYDSQSTVGWVRISDITSSDGKSLRSTRDYLSTKGIAQSRFLPTGSLIMSICATVGIPVITQIESCIHDGFVGFSNLQNVEREFFYYKLKELEAYFRSKGQTGSQSNLNSDIVRYCEVALPSLSEQRAIAQALSDVDALIAALDKLIAKKRDLKTATMQQLLTGKKRLPGFGEGKGYKESAIGLIPEDWEVKQMSSLATIQRGASPRPIESPIWYDFQSTVGWVRISDITSSDGKSLRATRDYLSIKGIAQSRFLPIGSLIMSICATVGIPVITQIDSCIHDGFVGFSNLQNVDQEFFYYKLKELEPYFRSKGQTGSQSNLNSDIVRNCEISLPLVPEQRAMALVLSDMDNAIALLESRLAKTQAIKQGMMQELLTGRTRLI